MKKILVLAVMLMMLVVTIPAHAESIDLETLTLDELVDLITLARAELTKRIGVIDNATFGRGTYVEGTMIAAGTYRFTCLETETHLYDVTAPCNSFVIKDSRNKERFSGVDIPINGVITFTVVEGDELRITGCSGIITRIENPVWLPDISATALPTANPTQNVSDVSTKENQVPSATSTKQASTSLINGVTPEFKKTMDEYEAFFDSYIEFMGSFDADSATIAQLTKYTQMTMHCAEAMEALDQIDESTLTEADDWYYMQVTLRINQKLAAFDAE